MHLLLKRYKEIETMNGFEIIHRLTSSGLPQNGRDRIFKDFAQELGWEPSDKLSPVPDLENLINGHIIVDHGLDNSAVITFLISPTTYSSLNSEQIKQVLSISYNNLIDWHIVVEQDRVTYIFNRLDPLEPQTHRLSQSDFEFLKGAMFDQITGKVPNPNFPTLDNALVENISYWKRNLAAELNNSPYLSDYSALFNSLIFVRAIEDHASRLGRPHTKILLEEYANQQEDISIRNIIENSLTQLINGCHPQDLIDYQKLEVFNNLQKTIVFDLLLSFYKNRRIPYPYDFAIMSKHALSRIYEHYVSILRFDESPQLSFLPTMPLEKSSKSFGSVYTPQFIARFFAKYIREQFTPGVFRKMKILDPACGSGIFLRTLLELQTTSTYDSASSQEILLSFDNVKGIDVDENAVQATKLSLSLLYMVLMDGELPGSLDILTDDALKYIEEHPEDLSSYDVVVANPPFISSENQSDDAREKISKYLKELSHGKVDSYLPFLKLAIDVLKPGGYGMFVVPHTFLMQESAAKLRSYLFEKTWIRCLVDLSTIPVFKDRGVYVILFIFQKKTEEVNVPFTTPKATLVLCKDFVGHALQDCLMGNFIDNQFYSVYEVEQEKFKAHDWIILSPIQANIKTKLLQFLPLREFLQVNQGIVTGADDVFIIPKSQVPLGEQMIWPQLLRDRDMMRYSLTKASQYNVFYPYLDNKILSCEEIQDNYPRTWDYLVTKQTILNRRKLSVNQKWWSLFRPRNPKLILGPKLITPHLILLPKFSFDERGKYLISHAPYLTAREGSDGDLIKFFLGILNSSIGAWLLSTHSDKYSRGYARLEVKSLGSIPAPDPSHILSGQLAYFLELVDKKIRGDKDLLIDREIDKVVASFYSLTTDELTNGLGFYNA